MEEYKEFIHFGLTSQDINNTSVPLSIKEALEQVYYPQIEELIAQLTTYAEEWANIPMLAKTHGQPASPTRLGKEIMVFVYRLNRQLAVLKACPVTAKFGGATGNYNAHHVAYPEYDWKAFGNQFVAEKLGLEREEYTTQISNYDNLGAIFDAMKRINTIMIDMNRDFWQYISMEYFKQKIKAGEVGSSAMPHKVNPIDFENAREAYPHPYEALKALTRTNQAITEGAIKEFIETLNVSEDIKKELRVITPHNYTGI